MSLILGIESSFDDTAVALLDSQFGLLFSINSPGQRFSHHFGGIVPQLTALDHVGRLLVNLQKSMTENRKRCHSINIVACTSEPGLALSLAVGNNVTSLLTSPFGIPAVRINHIISHVTSVRLAKHHPRLPFVSLVGSGKTTALHFQLNFTESLRLKSLGSGSAGEMLDKIARTLSPKSDDAGGSLLTRMSHHPILHLRSLGLRLNQKEAKCRDLRTLALLRRNALGAVTNQLGKGVGVRESEMTLANNVVGYLSQILVSMSVTALQKVNSAQLTFSGGVSSSAQVVVKLRQQLSPNQLWVCPRLTRTDNGAMIVNQCRLQNQEQEVLPLS